MPTLNSWRRPTLFVSGAAVLVVVAVLLFPEREPRDVSALAVFEPLAVTVPPGGGEAGSFEALRAEALYLYAEGDYANARTPFAHALLMRPDDTELRLYFASALTLDSDFERALPSLSRAATADDPLIRDEGLWLLANTQLALGREQEARAVLEHIIELKGRHASDAQRLLGAIL